MTAEYKSQLEALMMEKFNKLGRGTFGDGSKVYVHGRSKSSLAKIILDLALLGAGEPKIYWPYLLMNPNRMLGY